MPKSKKHPARRYILGGLAGFIVIFAIWQASIKVPTEGDWQLPLSILSTAEFKGDLVTVHNVRNFRYNGSENEADLVPNYYDKTYDLTKLSKVWYITEPFKGFSVAAHTFVSFEFSNQDFLSITIEARKLKGQDYNLYFGLLHTYPLMYIAADERDSVLVRTNIRKSDVYMYPVKLQKPENARLLLVDMLQRMNDLVAHPDWYNTLTANCTSSIAYHINRISPGRLPAFPWQLWLTGYADRLAYDSGLLDVGSLTLEEARQKYYITQKSQEIGAVSNYSTLIRQFD